MTHFIESELNFMMAIYGLMHISPLSWFGIGKEIKGSAVELTKDIFLNR